MRGTVRFIGEVSRETSVPADVTYLKHAATITDPAAIAARARAAVAGWLAEASIRPRAGFLERIERMAAMLAFWGAHTNLTAHPNDPEEIAFHVIDSLAPLAFAPAEERAALEGALAAQAAALDIGAGAGFPGLVLAAAFEARFTLVDSRRKRASYLEVAAREMNLSNVVVEQRRMSPRSVEPRFDLVTARAFGLLADVYAIAAAALGPRGIFLLYASSSQHLDVPAAQAVGLLAAATWSYRVAHGPHSATRTAALWRARGS